MLYFSKLGNYGRLGNQLFQYAFLREMARRLGTQFHCPTWDGDRIFDLADEDERVPVPGTPKHYFNAHPQAGYTPAAESIADGTEIEGFFQSERYYRDRDLVRRWYTFKPSLREAAERSYRPDDLADAVSLSLRIDVDYRATREYFPLYPRAFYERALKLFPTVSAVVVFADRPDLAKQFFGGMKTPRLRFADDLDPPSQLYVMSRCKGNIITNSTFAWWGAWLNARPDRIVVTPSAWTRPGIPIPIEGILCDEWVKVRATVPVWDHFQTWRLRHPTATVKRILTRIRSA